MPKDDIQWQILGEFWLFVLVRTPISRKVPYVVFFRFVFLFPLSRNTPHNAVCLRCVAISHIRWYPCTSRPFYPLKSHLSWSAFPMGVNDKQHPPLTMVADGHEIVLYFRFLKGKAKNFRGFVFLVCSVCRFSCVRLGGRDGIDPGPPVVVDAGRGPSLSGQWRPASS